jgi:hypothetical protein
MFQTGLAVYSGDQILSSLQKLAGTACGLIFGMFLWYFGACSTTSSNPYGLGAVVVVFMTPMMAIRIYAPPGPSSFPLLPLHDQKLTSLSRSVLPDGHTGSSHFHSDRSACSPVFPCLAELTSPFPFSRLLLARHLSSSRWQSWRWIRARLETSASRHDRHGALSPSFLRAFEC